jgi:inorganic pyrophosphatase
MLDIIIISMFALTKQASVKVRVIGELELVDQKGPDSKIIGVPVDEPRLS